MSTAYCIVGMVRSGTSLAAQAVRLGGVDFGNPEAMLSTVAQMNDEGFLEHTGVVNYHLKLLKAFGLVNWYASTPLLEGWWRAPELKPLKEELKQLIAAEFAGRTAWGWKDPRASVLLPLWREVLGELGIEMRVIIPFRSPLDVANSVARVWNLPMEQSWRLWLYYMLSIRDAVQGLPHFYLDYNALLADPRGEGRRLGEFLGATAPADLPELVAGVIRPSLRHSEQDSGQLEEQAGPDVAALYQECRGLPPQVKGPRLIRTLGDYLTAAKLLNLHRVDVTPTFQVSTVFGDYATEELSRKQIVQRLIPYTRDHQFDETYELHAPGPQRLFFKPCMRSLARCRIERIEADGVELEQAVRGSNASWQMDGWDVFPPQADPVYEIKGDFRQVGKVRIVGKLETVVAGTPAVNQAWVHEALGLMVKAAMAPGAGR